MCCLYERMYGVLKLFEMSIFLCFLVAALFILSSELVTMFMFGACEFFRLSCVMDLLTRVVVGFMTFGVRWISFSIRGV